MARCYTACASPTIPSRRVAAITTRTEFLTASDRLKIHFVCDHTLDRGVSYAL